MDAEAGLGVLVGAGLSAVMAGLAAWRLRAGRGQLEPVDGFMGLGILVWASVAATTGLAVGLGGAGADASPPLLVAVAGTGIGGLCAAGFAVARTPRVDLGLSRLAPGWCAFGLALVPAFLVVGAAWMAALAALGIDVQQQELLDVAGAGGLGPGEWAALVYGALAAPVIEELVFRGLVYASLARAAGATRAAVASGVLFGLLHISEPAAVGPLVVMGVVLGLLRARSGSLGPPLALHLGNNVLAMGLALAGVVGG